MGVALVGLVSQALDEAGLLHLLEHHGECGARDAQTVGEVALGDSIVVADLPEREDLAGWDLVLGHAARHEPTVGVQRAHVRAPRGGGGGVGAEELGRR